LFVPPFSNVRFSISMSESSPSNPSSTTPPAPPQKIITLSRRTADYLQSELLSRHLVREIKAYYEKRNPRKLDIQVWTEKERLGQYFVWTVRSNIVMTVPKL
jgi:hypothetical protein